MYQTGPFGEASGNPVPVQVETFHMLRNRQTSDGFTDVGDEPRRVNLLNWDGNGRPEGLFPPRRDPGADGGATSGPGVIDIEEGPR
jgi:nitrate reductase beta subunit